MGFEPGDGSATEVAVEIHGALESNPTLGKVEIFEWSQAARNRRAWKGLGAAWGIALFCVIIPLLHFVLVPAFFLAGIFAFAHFRRQSRISSGGEGVCPDCGKSFRIEKGPLRFPVAEICDYCRANLSVDLKDRQAAV